MAEFGRVFSLSGHAPLRKGDDEETKREHGKRLPEGCPGRLTGRPLGEGSCARLLTAARNGCSVCWGWLLFEREGEGEEEEMVVVEA